MIAGDVVPDSAELAAGGGSSRPHVPGPDRVSPWIGWSCAESPNLGTSRRVLWGSWRQPEHWAWYSGALKYADRALEAGLYFSVNPAMLHSQRGARLLRSLPRGRVLSETDGPFVTIGARRVHRADVPALVGNLAAALSCEPEEAREQVWQNMVALHTQAAAGRGRDVQTESAIRLPV